jgi:hypothetical protein
VEVLLATDSSVNPNKFHFEVIEWHECLHITLDKNMEKITLPGIPLLREFVNENLLDVLYFMSPVYNQKIIYSVTNSLNIKYQEFRAKNKSFTSNKICIVGHSLGSIISWDILTHQNPNLPPEAHLKDIIFPKLDFTCKYLFGLGSPIGLFLTARGIEPQSLLYKDLPFNYYNISHPYDVVAYRVEPILLGEVYASLNCVQMPYYKNNGQTTFTSLHEKITSFARPLFKQLELIDSKTMSQDVTIRYDFSLQETLFEHFNDYLMSIATHLQYWENKDVVYFITQILFAGGKL